MSFKTAHHPSLSPLSKMSARIESQKIDNYCLPATLYDGNDLKCKSCMDSEDADD